MQNDLNCWDLGRKNRGSFVAQSWFVCSTQRLHWYTLRASPTCCLGVAVTQGQHDRSALCIYSIALTSGYSCLRWCSRNSCRFPNADLLYSETAFCSLLLLKQSNFRQKLRERFVLGWLMSLSPRADQSNFSSDLHILITRSPRVWLYQQQHEGLVPD